VVKALKPVVGYLSYRENGDWGVPIRVPIFRKGSLRYVLTGVIKPDVILDVINRQHVPQDWVVSVFDGKGSRVARSHGQEKFIGSPTSASLQQLLANGGGEGHGISTSLEGDRIYTAYTRANDSQWTVVIGIPPRIVEAGINRSLAAYGGGILLSLIVGIVAALLIARSINRPIRRLASLAGALGRGEALAVPDSDIRELQELGNALVASAEQRARARAEREHLLAEAETANRAKDEFLAMLGHELRNPLAPIVTALHLMEIRKDSVTASERRIIERQVAHLSRLVDDLLDISRITRGKIELHREQLDMRAVVARALELTHPVLERHQPVILDLPSEPVFLSGDATRLTQVLCNLLTNAARHTPLDGRLELRRANPAA
jgi:signal transduction histidine kinase